jgi:hypothetical protein
MEVEEERSPYSIYKWWTFSPGHSHKLVLKTFSPGRSHQLGRLVTTAGTKDLFWQAIKIAFSSRLHPRPRLKGLYLVVFTTRD